MLVVVGEWGVKASIGTPADGRPSGSLQLLDPRPLWHRMGRAGCCGNVPGDGSAVHYGQVMGRWGGGRREILGMVVGSLGGKSGDEGRREVYGVQGGGGTSGGAQEGQQWGEL